MEHELHRHHFVLVHGGMHGAWAWYKVVDRLQKAGHKVTALDMAGAGTHPASPDSIATFEAYNQPVTEVFLSLSDEDHQKVVLIGHSLGGLSCLQFMESFSHKIGLVIFVSAVLTPSGCSMVTSGPLTDLLFNDTPGSNAIRYNFAEGPDKAPTSWFIAEPQMKDVLYTDWDSEHATVKESIGVDDAIPHEFEDDADQTRDFSPSTRLFVENLRDSTMTIAAQRWVAENLGPFEEVVEVDGGHFHYWVEPDEFVQLVLRLTKSHFAA